MNQKIRPYYDLLLTGIVSALLLVIISFDPPVALRVILGLPFMLFFPGYTLTRALFPGKSSMDSLERVALSFGLSIAATIFTGLLSNYTPWGLSVFPVVVGLAILILVFSSVALYRRRRLPEDQKPAFSFNFRLPKQASLAMVDKVLYTTLALAVLGVVTTVVYISVAPRGGEEYTEFYVLGPGGEAADYPEHLVLGEPVAVILGIVNHEGREVSYQIEIKIDGEENSRVGPLVLASGTNWEQEVGFTPLQAGEGQKVEFILFERDENEPLETLHLFSVDVEG